MRRMIVTASLLLSCGCAADEMTVVFVEPTIESTALDFRITPPAAIGTSGYYLMWGEVALNLHLAPRASEPGEVTLSRVFLTSAKTPTDALPYGPRVTSIPVTSEPEFPIVVDVDSDVAVRIHTHIEGATASSLCGPETRWILELEGAVEDGIDYVWSDPHPKHSCD